MLRHCITALLLVAACAGSLYPRFETVARNPSVFDLLFSTTAGVHNESWYFASPVNVSSFIIPTQMDWSSADFYPLHEVAVRDPKSFDLLYSSTSGTHNETWHFAKPANLSALIIASQAFNFNSGGLWPGGTYGEELQIEVYETVLARNAADEVTTLVGSGSISGPTFFGQELRVPVRTRNGSAVGLGQYYSTVSGYSYTFSVYFGSVGFYPWYNGMTLSAYSPVHQDTNGAGLIMGIAFSDG